MWVCVPHTAPPAGGEGHPAGQVGVRMEMEKEMETGKEKGNEKEKVEEDV